MKLHVVGGFLGSGKTTAISEAAKRLLQDGYRVGVITNDQGKYLVDTAFFQLKDVPAIDVTGGCFCCNYDDLDARLSDLVAATNPDIVFAESVGSCADLVATVLNPLMTLRHTPASLSVFADSRLLLRRLRGEDLPFADNVSYIFDKQIEEATLLVINKADLLSTEYAAKLLQLAQQKFPDKQVKLQNSRDDASVQAWLALLQEADSRKPTEIDIDYDRYGAGEAELAWCDAEVKFNASVPHGTNFIHGAIQRIVVVIRGHSAAIGHLKFVVKDAKQGQKISFTAATDDDWSQLPLVTDGDVTLLINARVELPVESLVNIVQSVLKEQAQLHNIQFNITHVDSFHPAFPRPTHRMPSQE